MLKNMRQKPPCFHFYFFPFDGVALKRYAIRTLDETVLARHAQTPLLKKFFFSGDFHDLRIKKRVELHPIILIGNLGHKNTFRDTDLIGAKPYPVSAPHHLPHYSYKLLQGLLRLFFQLNRRNFLSQESVVFFILYYEYIHFLTRNLNFSCFGFGVSLFFLATVLGKDFLKVPKIFMKYAPLFFMPLRVETSFATVSRSSPLCSFANFIYNALCCLSPKRSAMA